MNTMILASTKSHTGSTSRQCIVLAIILTLVYVSLQLELQPRQGCRVEDGTVTVRQTSSEARLSARPAGCANGGQRARSFLVVFMGHSGSTAILSELRGHSQTYMPDSLEPLDHELQRNSTQALRFTREFFARGIAAGKTPGFKMRPTHLLAAPDEWRRLARQFDTRIVWQYRKNILKAAVGEYTTRYLNDTSAVTGLRRDIGWQERCKYGAGCSFAIEDFDFFNDVLKRKLVSHQRISQGVNIVSGSGECVLEVPYEDYLYHPRMTMRRLQLFLGLDYERTRPKRFKATGDNLCNVVTNWKQLCYNFYSCVLWQALLDDERNQCFCSVAKGSTKYCNMPSNNQS